mmetsp:Transcript_6619/g.14504  ORF Transcript_6619/g.14504 Transcript_6619/m.14504 type:complete len:271 (-) Transcript_6619:61-873(-)
MCLILFSFQPENNNRLLVLSNRDEFYARPSERAECWTANSNPTILAGRDAAGGGTWLGVDIKRNRFAAVTNFRDGPSEPHAVRSRGSLPIDFLTSDMDSIQFLQKVHCEGSNYNGFNMIVFDGSTLAYQSNRSKEGPKKLGGGIYGVSNHLLDTPWPKVVKGKALLQKYLREHDDSDSFVPDASILDILLDRAKPPDDDLPDTGVGIELEREFSPLFVAIGSIQYGTRCSTLVVMDGNGPIAFVEKTLVPKGSHPDTVTFDFRRKNVASN